MDGAAEAEGGVDPGGRRRISKYKMEGEGSGGQRIWRVLVGD